MSRRYFLHLLLILVPATLSAALLAPGTTVSGEAFLRATALILGWPALVTDAALDFSPVALAGMGGLLAAAWAFLPLRWRSPALRGVCCLLWPAAGTLALTARFYHNFIT